MKQSLQVRLSQHLALTPQLQQSIRLLQLSTLELHQEVEQMLEQNPFLEAEEETAPAFEPLAERLTSAERAGEREAERAAEPGGDGADAGEPAAIDGAAEFGGTEREDWENGTEREDFDGIRETPGKTRTNNDFDDSDDSDRDTPRSSLQDHLRSQLAGMRLAPADAAAVLVLIDSLDDDGYLADSLEDIAERLIEGGLTLDAGVDGDDEADAVEPLLAHLRCALRYLQSMEPTGVGARDLAECLTLQLRTLERWRGAGDRDHRLQEPPAAARPARPEEADGRDRRRRDAAARGAGADRRPRAQAGAAVRARRGEHRRPRRDRAEVRARLEGAAQPRRDAEAAHQRPLRQRDPPAPRQPARSTAPAAGLNSRLQEARWFVKNILQRFDTIQRVSQAIVERQKSFFTHGAIAMKPLVLREIADELGLHESTISRVTTAKYMATPFGTFELKYFFGSSLATEAGGNASSTAVRALIRQIVAAEDPAKPLSDSQISQMLDEQGIHVARRTVAKYREALKIAPTQLRKAM